MTGGRHFLFWVLGPSGVRGAYLGSLGDHAITRLVEADGPAALAPPDQVLFIREGVLYGQSLDVNGARMIGEPIPIASGFRTTDTEPPRVSASHTGVMAFRTDPESRRQIEWVDRDGARLVPGWPVRRVRQSEPDRGPRSLERHGRWRQSEADGLPADRRERGPWCVFARWEVACLPVG